MNIVVTGINGFVGKHLTQTLLGAGHSVVGISQEDTAHELVADRLVEYVGCNLAEQWPSLNTPVDAIIHLAGMAAVGPSFDKPQLYLNINSSIVTNLCEYYLASEAKPRILLVSSGAIYSPDQPMPINESGEVLFGSPYAVSKILNENQAAYYRSRGLDCVVARPFNHIGPGQLPGFLVPDLIEKIQSRESSDIPIRVGNLATKRDYTDVRDVANAYMLIATHAEQPKQLIYNICSGTSISGEDMLHIIASAMQIKVPATEIDQAFIRPNEVMDIRGDSTVLMNEFGWQPQINIETTIRDIIASK